MFRIASILIIALTICGIVYLLSLNAVLHMGASSTAIVTDLTWLFWTKLCEKLSLERSFGYAEEEV